jgi:hypothetical protein
MSDEAAQDRRALEDFVVDNADLEQLEALLDKCGNSVNVIVVRPEESSPVLTCDLSAI